MPELVTSYKTFDIYKMWSPTGESKGFTVQFAGDELYFETVEEAMNFIDSL